MNPKKPSLDVRYALYLPIDGSISGFNSKINNIDGAIIHFGLEVNNWMSES